MNDAVKYIVIAACVLTPMFILSHELSSDEFIKAGGGVLMATIAVAALKLLENWKPKNRP